jgi:putative SOS response-associated peptidase YedK
MCGRYYIDDESDLLEIRKILADLNDRFRGQPALDALKTREIFPSQVVPVIRSFEMEDHTARLLPDLMAWGIQSKSLLINARAETAAIKSTFRQSLATRRVLVPATAFFEWQTRSGQPGKMKIRLFRPEEPVFYMAGLFQPLDAQDNPLQVSGTFVILTRPANASVAPVHDRMPLIVPRDQLRPYLQDPAAAFRLLQADVAAQLTLQTAD